MTPHRVLALQHRSSDAAIEAAVQNLGPRTKPYSRDPGVLLAVLMSEIACLREECKAAGDSAVAAQLQALVTAVQNHGLSREAG